MTRKSLVPIQLPADPTQLLEAATKQYADTKQPLHAALTAWSTRYIPRTATLPDRFLMFEASDNGGNYVQLLAPLAVTADVSIYLPNAAGTVALTSDVTTAAGLRVLKAGDTMTGTLVLSGAAPSLTATTRADFAAVRATGNISNGAPSLTTFHTADFVTRNGYVGEAGGRISLVAEAAGYPVRLESPTSIVNRVGTTDIMTVDSAGLQLPASTLQVGKTDGLFQTKGFLVTADGRPHITLDALGSSPILYLNRIGTGITTGAVFAQFTLTGSVIGSITRNAATSAVLYNVSSDYRLKNDRGLITGALDRVKALMPRRITWKSDPDEIEQDAFFAHEVAEVVPEAVSGDKDAVATEDDVAANKANEVGGVMPQQLDASKLIPLLTAALQEALTRIEALEARLAAS